LAAHNISHHLLGKLRVPVERDRRFRSNVIAVSVSS
jgi:hypothetical protein